MCKLAFKWVNHATFCLTLSGGLSLRYLWGMFVFILLWHTRDLLHSYTLVLCAQLSQRPRGGQNQDRPLYTLRERLCVWVRVIGWQGCPLAPQRGFSHRVAIFTTVGVFHAAPSSKSNSPALISDTCRFWGGDSSPTPYWMYRPQSRNVIQVGIVRLWRYFWKQDEAG